MHINIIAIIIVIINISLFLLLLLRGGHLEVGGGGGQQQAVGVPGHIQDRAVVLADDFGHPPVVLLLQRPGGPDDGFSQPSAISHQPSAI